MRLSERIIQRRADRLDEWSMDELAVDVMKIELVLCICEQQLDEVQLRGVVYIIDKIKKMGKSELMLELEKLNEQGVSNEL